MTTLQRLLVDLSAGLGGDIHLRRKLGEDISSGLLSGWINDGVVPSPEHMTRLGALAGKDQAEIEHLWWEAAIARRNRRPRRKGTNACLSTSARHLPRKDLRKAS